MFNTLLVEDDVCYRKTLSDLLLLHFPLIGVDEASDGREALNKVEYSHLSTATLQDAAGSAADRIDGAMPKSPQGRTRGWRQGCPPLAQSDTLAPRNWLGLATNSTAPSPARRRRL